MGNNAAANEVLKDFTFEKDVGHLIQSSTDDLYTKYHVVRRNGSVVGFEPHKITLAVTKAFLDVESAVAATSARVREVVYAITAKVVDELVAKHPTGGSLSIEDIQNTVERALMASGEYEVAKSYILYRDRHASARAKDGEHAQVKIHVTSAGVRAPMDTKAVKKLIAAACAGLEGHVSADAILTEAMKNVYDGIPVEELRKALLLAARALMEQDPDYSVVAARLLLNDMRLETLGVEVSQEMMRRRYPAYFKEYIALGIKHELLSEELAKFDLEALGAALDASRDLQFNYLGLQTLYDRYFIHIDDKRIELPQAFYMRVAMGVALNEKDRTGKAIEFYNLLSSFDFMSSTPTLFNSGTRRSQLSSCYLSTVSDDLEGIYDAIKDNALLSKFAGGLGNDWTPVRALGSRIKGTNGKSQGVVPFLKVVNDTAVAVNQGGKRKGAVCAYLETWHMDIEEFLDLRKNTGDDRRRTHDMNTANWIPDLFMKRVMEAGDWTLFTPSETPDLHDLVGKAFERAYTAYEAKAERGEMMVFKKVKALDLWRKMLSMLFETGHPWIAFKDPCNIRSPQQHVGVVHSSNLCTEITLNTSDEEIAVCNLGSINMAQHMVKNSAGKWVIDHVKLQKTIRSAMRMLDNVIDVNYYAVAKARNSNLKHRPVGMGIMGFQDALHIKRVPFASQEAVQFADESMEAVCYYAYLASSDLAVERGTYSSYEGSLWSKGILPLDSVKMLADERGGYLEVDMSSTMDWEALRAKILRDGMRNSNCVAIAPTATISNIINVSACIEPTYQNLYVKSNLSGEFTVTNGYMVRDLKERGLWDAVMVADLKHFDGSLGRIDRVPEELRQLYATAFEVSPSWLVEQASRRQKWIDQAQSLNIYMAGASGKKLDETYKLAWTRGLKTTYYLRTIAASHGEKSTGRAGDLNAVAVNAPAAVAPAPVELDGPACMMRPGDPGFDECEACQ
jgi:ribonucleoside-diphosphate reductase alpha chain